MFTYTSLPMGRGLVGRFVTSQYWSVIAVLLCKALVHVAAYPLCTDLSTPFQPPQTLSFCTSYASFGCCDTAADDAIRTAVTGLGINDTTCYNTFKAIYCSLCDPYSAELYGALDLPSPPLPIPDSLPQSFAPPPLCTTLSGGLLTAEAPFSAPSPAPPEISTSQPLPYCQTVYEQCMNVPTIASPYAAKTNYVPSQNNPLLPTSLLSYYASKEAFCHYNAPPTSAICFNGSAITIPPPIGLPKPSTICFEKVASGAYTNLVPHPNPSYPNQTFLTTRGGMILLVNLTSPGSPQAVDEAGATTFLDLTKRLATGVEMGLQGLVFDPKFSTNAKFYVSYDCDSLNPLTPDCANATCGCYAVDGCSPTTLQKAQKSLGGMFGVGECRNVTVIAEYVLNGTATGQAPPNLTEFRRILTYGHPFNNRRGGQLHFGPTDGDLYFQFGDGGGGEGYGADFFNLTQNLKSLQGKVGRINVNIQPTSQDEISYASLDGYYSIPPTNPYASGGGARREIYALGLRDPRRCEFDSQRSSYLLCGDVGQGTQEVDLVSSGGNYGWRGREGGNASSPAVDRVTVTPPVIEYKGVGGAGIVGGFVSRSSLDACLFSRYVYSTIEGSLSSATEDPPDSGRFTSSPLTPKCSLTSPLPCNFSAAISVFGWGEDSNGDLYLLASNGVYRMLSQRACGLSCEASFPPPHPPPVPPPPPTLSFVTPNQSGSVPPLSPSPGAVVVGTPNRLLTILVVLGLIVVVSLGIICGCCIMGHYRYNPRPTKAAGQFQRGPGQEEGEEMDEEAEYEPRQRREATDMYESDEAGYTENYNERGTRRTYRYEEE